METHLWVDGCGASMGLNQAFWMQGSVVRFGLPEVPWRQDRELSLVRELAC